MKQYNTIKAKYPDALLLFRVGDFYETFGEDAIKTSSVLGIVLTRRANGAASFVELAGFPHHALDTYLPKLVRSGFRVAICDQLEDPKTVKGIVKRGVTELVTPGLTYNDKILENKKNNFLAAIHINENLSGVSFLDISTGEFLLAEGDNEHIDKLLQTFTPNEIIVQKNKKNEFVNIFGKNFYINTFDDWVFTYEFGFEKLIRHFNTTSLKGFGVEELNYGIIAAGVIIHYLHETQHDKLSHVNNISRIEKEHFVWLDRFTIRNLEILSSFNEKGKSLLNVIDKTVSPMGSRLIRRWITMPLKERKTIFDRQEAVTYFVDNNNISNNILDYIKTIGDLERLISKVAFGKITPREVAQLRQSLIALEPIKNICQNSNVESLKVASDQINICHFIIDKIEKELSDDPPVAVSKGNAIAVGVSDELDELRLIASSGKEFLIKLQEKESEKTGIPSLKIGYNNVFGYYLEVTNTHKSKVPGEWERKQTLVNAERYITPELKEYEYKILTAQDKILELETEIFNNLVLNISEYVSPIQINATIIAKIDCLLSLAKVAVENNYCKPDINDTDIIEITEGRHPVIEQALPLGEKYISNNLFVDNNTQQILIITGPNMSGKSAFLRQTALIVLLSQIGGYVPAKAARIGIVDKIFTRVGASDNISSGESTFMVEMNEAASILNNVSSKSLILLDEIGRGTSTYDGISIAWAMTEYLHEHPTAKPKVIFATHYHELNEMTNIFNRIKNFHVTVKEVGNTIVFTRKLKAGGSEHSFGIHVARMAGMPQIVLQRANLLLKELEKQRDEDTVKKRKNNKNNIDPCQLSFIQLNDPLLEQIKNEILGIDINILTPVEALMKLNDIKKLLKNL